MKPVDVKYNTYINFKKGVSNKNPKFKVGDHLRISKYKNVFAKGHTPSQSEEVFAIKKVKNIVPWTYVINDLNGEGIIGIKNLMKKNLENKKQLKEKVINYMSNGKGMLVHLIIGLIKKVQCDFVV